VFTGGESFEDSYGFDLAEGQVFGPFGAGHPAWLGVEDPGFDVFFGFGFNDFEALLGGVVELEGVADWEVAFAVFEEAEPADSV